MDKIAQGNQAAALEHCAGQHRIAIMDHGICAASDPQENLCELRVGNPATMPGQCQQCSLDFQFSCSVQMGQGSPGSPEKEMTCAL